MNTANLFITLLLFFTFRDALCSESAGDKEYENLVQLYTKWMQKSWTPDMFAFRGRISPISTATPVNPKYVTDSVQYADGVYNSLFENFTSQCTRDLLYIITSYKSEWAIEMLDSDGKLPSGLLGGNIKWPGDYTECKNVYAPPKPNNSMGNFHGRYCTATFTLSMVKLQLPLSVGICVPDTCDGPEIKLDIQNILYIIERFPVLNKVSGTMNLTDISCKPLEVELDGPAIAMICLLSVLGFLMAVGSSVTIFEYFFPCTKKDFPYSGNHLFIQSHTENVVSIDASVNNVIPTGESVLTEHSHNGTDDKQILVDSSPEHESFISAVARSVKSFCKNFCILTNGAKILSTNVAEGQLSCIHGLRFFSMAWVILGHTYAFAALNGIGAPAVLKNLEPRGSKSLEAKTLSGAIREKNHTANNEYLPPNLKLHLIMQTELRDLVCNLDLPKKIAEIVYSIAGNLVDTIHAIDTWKFQVILQGTLSVDSFFVLSGFLLTYLFLKEADKNGGKVSWPLFYIHRYWRLTPVYMITLGFDAALTKYLSSGPFWAEGGFDVMCKKSWWRNLLYINNFGDENEQCFGWSWYLANDMQFYIISPIFLYALWRWPKAGLSIVFTLLLSSWITSAVITTKYNLIATYGGITTATNTQQIMNQMGDYFWKLYVKPYTRISTYLIGVLVGYILYKTGNKKKFLEPWSQLLGWSIATALPLFVIFGVYDITFSMPTAAAYNALGRSAYALSIAWVIYACQTGHGDIVNKILSFKLFIPLSRLTYCAYLVHPIVLIGFYQSLLKPIYFSHLIMVVLFFGLLVMSYMIALIMSLTMESPMMGLEKLLLKKR